MCERGKSWSFCESGTSKRAVLIIELCLCCFNIMKSVVWLMLSRHLFKYLFVKKYVIKISMLNRCFDTSCTRLFIVS